ncbi:MAG TPA: aspartyl protease family protein [Candidatus Saccharimonadales bacterium]|nr:aspartyl protease family protein [Candidatus Saccharimonadales bacterium]
MRLAWLAALAALASSSPGPAGAQEPARLAATVPVVLDHNRMLVEAQFQRPDGSWRTARLWVDTGNPDFFMTASLARDLGIEFRAPADTGAGGQAEPVPATAPKSLRVGGLDLSLEGVSAVVMPEPHWMYTTMHNDGNLPSTVLMHWQVAFDYPKRQLTLARPGSFPPRGVRAPASVNPRTGIVQIDATLGGDSLSLALDNGASYSFLSEEEVARLARRHPDWPRGAGAVGCANIWGQWPQEAAWPLVRAPELQWGPVRLEQVGLVGLPRFFPNGSALGDWYSQKAARHVDGFLGPNAFRAFRVEIDYAGGAVYFERGAESDAHDLDLVGLTLQPQADGSYRVLGVASRDGRPAVAGVEPGDVLLQVGDLKATGATMGAVVDALRGAPGEARSLVLERGGRQLRVAAKVVRFL